MLEQAPGSTCNPRRAAHTGAGSQAGTLTLGERTLEQSIPEVLHRKDPCWRSL